MEAKVSILARVPDVDGYRLVTLEKKRGSFVKPDNAISYYLRYTDALTKKRITAPAGEDFTAAVVKALNVETNQAALRNGQEPAVAPVMTKADRLTVRDAVKQWIDTFPARLERWKGKADNGLSPASITIYTQAAEDFLAYGDRVGVIFMPRTDRTGEQMADEVNAEMLKSYESHLRKTLPVRHRQNGEAKDRQGSIIAKFRILQGFFSHFSLFICERPRALDGRGILKRQDMPKVNVAKKLREAKAKQTQTVVIYSDEEIKAMLDAATMDEADLIKFLLETGVRDKEAAHCEWSDIDGNHLFIRDKLTKYGWQAKDKEIRSIPLRPALVTRLKARKLRQEKQAKQDGREAPTLIFPNKFGRPNLALDNVIQRVVERAKANGFKWNPKSEVTMHKFRKNYATLMHRAGATVVTIRDLLGHSDEATTQLYIAPEPQKAAEVSKIAFEAFGD